MIKAWDTFSPFLSLFFRHIVELLVLRFGVVERGAACPHEKWLYGLFWNIALSQTWPLYQQLHNVSNVSWTKVSMPWNPRPHPMLQKNLIFPPRKRQFCDARELYLDSHIAHVHAFMIFPSHVSCQNVYKYSDEGSVPTSCENISGPGLRSVVTMLPVLLAAAAAQPAPSPA